jgi:hypothetical protein
LMRRHLSWPLGCVSLKGGRGSKRSKAKARKPRRLCG